MRNRGSVVDTLVFLLVAILLPAWLLGHLFLMFFPAPANTVAAASTVAAANTVAATAGRSTKSANAAVLGAAVLGATAGEAKANRSPRNPPDAKPFDARLLDQQQAFDAQRKQWESTSASLDSKIAQLRSENTSLNRQATAARDSAVKLASQDSLIAGLRRQLKLNTTTEETSGDFELSSRETDNRSQELAALNERYQTLDARAKRLQTQVTTLTTEQQQLQQLTRTSSIDRDEVAKYRAQVAGLQKQLSDATAEAQRQQQLVRSLKSTSAEAAGANEADQRARRQQQLALDAARREKETLQAKLDGLTTQVTTANVQLKARENELAAVHNTLKLLTQQQRSRAPASGNLSPRVTAGDPTVTLDEPQTTQPPATEVYRDYASSRGDRSKLAFVRWAGDDVVVRSFLDKKLYQLPLKRFSNADQQYLSNLKQP